MFSVFFLGDIFHGPMHRPRPRLLEVQSSEGGMFGVTETIPRGAICC